MKTAGNFLDDVKAAKSLRSDYQLAKYLGWNQQRITKIRGGATFDDEAARQIADALKLQPAYVATCMAAQRAKTPGSRKMWEGAAKTIGGTAAAVLLAACATLAPLPWTPAAHAASAPGLYIMLSALLMLIGTRFAAPHSTNQ